MGSDLGPLSELQEVAETVAAVRDLRLGDVGRCGEMWGDMTFGLVMWGDVGRYGEIWGDI